MTDTEKLNKIKSIIAWMLNKYKDDEVYFGGYTAINRLNTRAPEDDNELRTDWYEIREYADDMYYMLDNFKNNIEEIQEIIHGEDD